MNIFLLWSQKVKKSHCWINGICAGSILFRKPIAHIYDLAVSTSYQRKGIGSKLIAFANEYCKQSGFEEVFVQAEKDDDYAIDFYRSTKPAEELEAVHFSYKFT